MVSWLRKILHPFFEGQEELDVRFFVKEITDLYTKKNKFTENTVLLFLYVFLVIYAKRMIKNKDFLRLI